MSLTSQWKTERELILSGCLHTENLGMIAYKDLQWVYWCCANTFLVLSIWNNAFKSTQAWAKISIPQPADFSFFKSPWKMWQVKSKLVLVKVCFMAPEMNRSGVSWVVFLMQDYLVSLANKGDMPMPCWLKLPSRMELRSAKWLRRWRIWAAGDVWITSIKDYKSVRSSWWPR